jgi:predicted RNA-binding protein with RPS1 domain
MKNFLPHVFGTVVLPLVLSVNVSGESLPPGQVDFGAFSSFEGGEFVEVNISSSLISLATKFVEKDQPDIAQVLKGLQLVHVKVIGVNEGNRSELETRVQGIRKDLESKGWERIVKVQEKAQDVGVYLKTQNKDTVQGLVVVVIDGNKEAVFVNVVGDIKPEQLSMLGEKLHIDPLKKIGDQIEK